ncbi:hypothetical protein [Leptotrichia trevisanii]|uniref:hypothetical protein n=1 Tax=Leptotrichia trevisanii TaxID=109328 RepID=UPI0026EAC583|nr:hypothetical protein [Leptotrichia trevisanii]
MQEKEIFRFEKSGIKSIRAWGFIGVGIFGLLIPRNDGDNPLIPYIGLATLIYGIFLFLKKSKVVIYTNSFILSKNKKIINISFDKILGIKGEFGKKIKIICLKKPFSEYSEEELKNINDTNQKDFLETIILDDDLLENNFNNLVDNIKEQFKNYIFKQYDNDTEKVISSPYLFNQINDNKLDFTKTKSFGGLSNDVVLLQYNDAINTTIRKKNYLTDSKKNKIFEPQWQFASTSIKYDTANLINSNIIKYILIKKYNIKFI